MEKFKKWVAAYIQHRMVEKRKKQSDPKYKKFEFSKKVAVFCCVMMIVAFVTSVVLSMLDKDTLSDITVAVYSVCGSGILGYVLKSAFEKNSRNKYGLDEFGNPFGNIGLNADYESEEESEYESEETEEDIYG